MQITAVVVLAFAASSQAISISDRLVNYTIAASNVDKNVTTLANGPPPPLPPRPPPQVPNEPYLPLYANANDATWEKAMCKGRNFVRAMRGSDREAGQVYVPPQESAASEFEHLDFDFAEKWGWTHSEKLLHGNLQAWGVDQTLRDLGSSDKCWGWGGSVDCLTFIHGFKNDKDGHLMVDDSTYDVDGKTYRRSGAHYGLAFEAQKGIIIAMSRKSPQAAGKAFNPPVQGDELPAISASSDIMWLYWKMYNNPKNLNYFMTLSIENEETQGIVSRAVRQTLPKAQSFPAWGGWDFDTDTPEGQAILGSPNAQAFSYLLLQHKATLGNLYISSTRVFRDNREDPALNILLIVEPAPEDDGKETPGDETIANKTSSSTNLTRRDRSDSGVDIAAISSEAVNENATTIAHGDPTPAQSHSEPKQPSKPPISLFTNATRRIKTADAVNIAALTPENLPAPVPLIVLPSPVPQFEDEDEFLNLYPNAYDEEWEKARCKGANFVRAMRGSDSEAGQIFDPPRDTAAGLYDDKNLDDLTTWGWTGKEAVGPDMAYWGIDHVLRDIGASDTLHTKGGDVRLVAFNHGEMKPTGLGPWQSVTEQHYEVAGKVYRYTDAHYYFALDEINGIIIATARLSPQEAGRRVLPSITGPELPLIRAFSDLAWLAWANLADQMSSDPKNIHYFMTISIANELTQRILSRCIRELLPGSWGFPAWPGLEFSTATALGQALLGTPNAQAFSYFLLQHKKELGNLYISKIRVFHDRNWMPHPNLLLVVEPVPVQARAGRAR